MPPTSLEHHTKKVVQMHYLARNFAARLQEELEQSNSIHQFGPTLQYNKVFLGTIDSEYVTVEEYAPGTFIKYINEAWLGGSRLYLIPIMMK